MRWMTALLCCLLLTILSLTACSMKPTLPRNMELKAFDPHRKEFSCMYEVDHVPPVDPEAEAWFQEGMRVTGRDLQPNQRYQITHQLLDFRCTLTTKSSFVV